MNLISSQSCNGTDLLDRSDIVELTPLPISLIWLRALILTDLGLIKENPAVPYTAAGTLTAVAATYDDKNPGHK